MILKLGIIIYIIIACIHLTMCFIEQEKWRKITKPMLMITLLVTSIIYGYNSNQLTPILYFAIGLGLIGDILLIFDNNHLIFGAGGVTFFFGHVLYIVQMISVLPFTIRWYFYFILALFLIAWCVLTTPKLKSNLKILAIPCSIYSFILMFGVVIGMISLLTNISAGNLMLVIGFLLFIVSDTILVVAVFYKNIKRYHFYLMIPYIIAQLLLAYGILLR